MRHHCLFSSVTVSQIRVVSFLWQYALRVYVKPSTIMTPLSGRPVLLDISEKTLFPKNKQTKKETQI